MKSTTTLLAALSLLSPNLVHARTCTAGLKYCGYNLLKIGDYGGEITQELYNHHLPINEDHVKNSVLACSDYGNGWIGWKDYCSTGCRDGGSGNSDHC